MAIRGEFRKILKLGVVAGGGAMESRRHASPPTPILSDVTCYIFIAFATENKM